MRVTLLNRPADRWVLAAAGAHGAGVGGVVAVAAQLSVVGWVLAAVFLAVGMCWGSNTVSHIHLHRPLFRSQVLNTAFSFYLTALSGVPQRWWRRLHLQHHGASRSSLGVAGVAEFAVVAGIAFALAMGLPSGFGLWAVSYTLGLGLCALQGHQEHAGSSTGVDHRGVLYNAFWFNDGFHEAHHRVPNAHWTTLPSLVHSGDKTSAWPPVLRWLSPLRLWLARSSNSVQGRLLDWLERHTSGSAMVRRVLIGTHQRAIAQVLGRLDNDQRNAISDVTIVGGGLFPRSALVLSRLLPGARLTLMDSSARHLFLAKAWLTQEAPDLSVNYVHATFDSRRKVHCDLLVVPLAFRGDRDRLFAAPPAPLVLVHDWLWRRRGTFGFVVSPWLLKRMNLVSSQIDLPAFDWRRVPAEGLPT